MIQPPTDNLYKFMAISGLVIMLLSIGFVWKKYEEHKSRLLVMFGQIQLAKHQIDKVSFEIKRLENEKERLESEKKATGKPIPKEALDSFSKELFGKVQPLHEKVGELLVVDGNAIREIQFLERLLHIYIWAAIISSALGLAMTTLGFYLWYVRVQRFLDRELKQNKQGGC